jgi:hypothetical protein
MDAAQVSGRTAREIDVLQARRPVFLRLADPQHRAQEPTMRKTKSLELFLAVAGLGAMVMLGGSVVHQMLNDAPTVSAEELSAEVSTRLHKAFLKLDRSAKSQARARSTKSVRVASAERP